VNEAEGGAVAGSPVIPSDPEIPEVRFGPDGLLPAIVQDATDGRVLMLAWMDAEALAASVASGEVHFHSRSRNRLWRKGETSGNVLRVVSVAVDCDRDAVLVTADPAGPTCHRGARSCFDPEGALASRLSSPTSAAAEPDVQAGTAAAQGFAWLESLWSTIDSRASERPAGSYTTGLLEGGVDAVGRKVTEEAIEVLLAAKDNAAKPDEATRTALAGEAADLFYHALVLLAEREVPPSAVIDTLRSRQSRSADASLAQNQPSSSLGAHGEAGP
jgi:phosphoribosyl-AMP cyclohydrolase / phosphoribosyl-ATP pyrophosphohydrolase